MSASCYCYYPTAGPADADEVKEISTIAVPDLLAKIYSPEETNPEKFQADVVVSYSSVEHDGLGRYSDPLNPMGDMHAVMELYDMTKPGGVLLLAVPSFHEDFVFFVSARGYGPIRLPMLATQDRWQYLGTVSGGEYHEQMPFAQPNCDHKWAHHPVVMLRRVPEHELHLPKTQCTLNCTDALAAVKALKAKKPLQSPPGGGSPFVCQPSSHCERPMLPLTEATIAELTKKVPQIQPACPPHECSRDGRWKECAAGTKKWPAATIAKWL